MLTLIDSYFNITVKPTVGVWLFTRKSIAKSAPSCWGAIKENVIAEAKHDSYMKHTVQQKNIFLIARLILSDLNVVLKMALLAPTIGMVYVGLCTHRLLCRGQGKVRPTFTPTTQGFVFATLPSKSCDQVNPAQFLSYQARNCLGSDIIHFLK